MVLSIIIVNYNVKHYLEQCLLSCEAALAGFESEIFVVDNASTDGSEDYFRSKFPQVKFIWNRENIGFARANNQAIRQATGRYILLLNPDTLVAESTFSRVCPFLDEHPSVGAVGVKMIDRYGHFLPESKRSLPTLWNSFSKMFGLAGLFPKTRLFGKYRLLYLDENLPHQVEVLSGAFMMLRAEALRKSGLLDESFFMYGEDIDLSYRVLMAGYQNYYLPETIIHYKGESTKKGSIQYIQSFYGAMLIFYKKHYPRQSALFSFWVKSAIFIHSHLTLIRNVFHEKVSPKSAHSAILYPLEQETFGDLIKRVELQKQ